MRLIIGLTVGALIALSTSENGINLNAAKWTAAQLTQVLPHTEMPAETAAQNPGPAVSTPNAVTETEPETNSALSPEPDQSQMPTSAAAGQVSLQTEPVGVGRAPRFQVAWTRFRSEASARGFATRLGEALDMAFETVRVGPGNYEVGFYFIDETQRDEALTALEAFTGYRANRAL
ncbi:MAG: hypothetical protein VW831_03095 [Gammaproteobacteria bacterium]|jgi:hypothetical protein